MGVPKFYRWLSERYPQINQIISDSSLLPEIDNLYLDMNGIIHACTHPNDNDTANSLTLREMMFSIFRYIDRMVTEIAKPKKLLFMAIDGVAPRAKLNQQRARRFRAAQDRIESMTKARQRGEVIDESAMFDSNCITPGTEFMELVGKHIRWFIRKKIKEDPLWRNLEIVFSGHDVPGEGEHKIMQFIREERAKPGYEPNQRHCMYGQDADLIMLGLATHEPHFTLLREVVNFNAGRPNRGSARETVLRQTRETQFQLMHLSVLREYLELELAIGAPYPLDKERLVNDFIFLTFLVGNDFLPHLPTLDIGEHAFDVIYGAYKSLLHSSTAANPPYIVQNGEIGDLDMLEKLFQIIGSQEAEILMNREEEVKSFNARLRKNKDNIVPTDEELEEAEEERQRLYELAVQEALFGTDRGSGSGASSASASASAGRGSSAADPMGGTDGEDEGEAFQAAGKPRKAPKAEKKSSSKAVGDAAPPGGVKDYRGRYYYEKFKVIVSGGGPRGEQFMSELKQHYLQGLMWCLAYYVKGCISWTWYYPYHYGPMLQDMTQLNQISGHIQFSIGQPFRPFQQLLGCLPPASRSMLPRCYQWLMTSPESPMLKYYPEEFGIDQDGKKNPWEAVVLLSFIDEKELLAAEALHCKEDLLSVEERQRNSFGKVLAYTFDPNVSETYFSCNPEIGLPDVTKCQSTVKESFPDLSPGAYFRPELIPGTISPIAGFPSLAALRMQKVETDFFKINVFGSESRYRTMVMEVEERAYDPDQLDLSVLVGKIVYVNYPQMHEAKVVAITTAKGEFRQSKNVDSTGKPEITRTQYTAKESEKWKEQCEEEMEKYFRGRGTPGSGGLRIGAIRIRLRVCVLQGMRRDPVTGASKKVYGTDEADVPIQLALWSAPTIDPRFQETEEQPVSVLFPHGAEVVATFGQLIGCKGKVIGPHRPADAGNARSSLRKAKAKQGASDAASFEAKGESVEESKGNDDAATAAGDKSAAADKKSRVVDAEFYVQPPEPPFGHAIAQSIQEEYFPARDVCRSLGISPSVLGKIVGSIFVEPGRYDLGLNLKRNGQYQLLGYVRKVSYENSAHGETSNGASASGAAGKGAWGHGDTVQVVGMIDNSKQADAAESVQWEYSAKAIALLFDYKTKFPMLFDNLERLPHQKKYPAHELVPPSAVLPPAEGKPLDPTAGAEVVKEWMKLQPFFAMPRTPLTTVSLSREAMRAIERASDVRTSYLAASGTSTVVVRNVPVEYLYRGELAQSTDAPLAYNGSAAPRLGDRIVNLKATGVPFGLRGTVVAMHSSTGYVEAIFDEEFVGGRGLQGNCSQFRGRLCAWNALLRVSAVHHNDKGHGHGVWGHSDAQHGHKLKSAVGAAALHPPHTPHTPHTLDVKDVMKIVTKASVGGKKHTPAPAAAPATSTESPEAEAEKARSILLRRVDGAPSVAGVEAGNKLLRAISGKGDTAAPAAAAAVDMSTLLKNKLNISGKVSDSTATAGTSDAAGAEGTPAAVAVPEEKSKVKITKEVAKVASGAGGAAFRIFVKTDEPGAEGAVAAAAAAENKKKKAEGGGGGGQDQDEAEETNPEDDLVAADVEIEVDPNFKSDGTGRAALAMAAGLEQGDDAEASGGMSVQVPQMQYPPMAMSMPMPYPFMPGFPPPMPMPMAHPGMMPLPMFAPLPPHMMPPFQPMPLHMPFPFPPPPPANAEDDQQQQQREQQQSAEGGKGRAKSPTKRAASPQKKPAKAHAADNKAAAHPRTEHDNKHGHEQKAAASKDSKNLKEGAHTPVGHKLLQHIKGGSSSASADHKASPRHAAAGGHHPHPQAPHTVSSPSATAAAHKKPAASSSAAAAGGDDKKEEKKVSKAEKKVAPGSGTEKQEQAVAAAAAAAATTTEGGEPKKAKKLSASETLQNAKKAMQAKAAAAKAAAGEPGPKDEKSESTEPERPNAGSALMAMLASSSKEKAPVAAPTPASVPASDAAVAAAAASGGGSNSSSAVSALKAMLGSTKEKTDSSSSAIASTFAPEAPAAVPATSTNAGSNAGGSALMAFLNSSTKEKVPESRSSGGNSPTPITSAASASASASVPDQTNGSGTDHGDAAAAAADEAGGPGSGSGAAKNDPKGEKKAAAANLVPASVLVRKKAATAAAAPAVPTSAPASAAPESEEESATASLI